MVKTTLVKQIPIAKLVIMTNKTEKRGKKLETPTIQRDSPICAICDVIGHPTHIFLELDDLKPLLGSNADIAMPRSRKRNLPPKVKENHYVPIMHALSAAIMDTIPIIALRSRDIGMPYTPLSNPIKRIPPPRHPEMNLIPSYTYRKNEGH